VAGFGRVAGGYLGDVKASPMPQIDRHWLGGYVRDGVFIIRRSINGKRYDITTRCTTEKAALKCLEAFEASPATYKPGKRDAPTDAVIFTEVIAQEFLDAMKAKGNAKAWRLIQANILKWWAGKLGSRDLRHITASDVRRHLKDTTRYPHKLAVIKALFRWLREQKETKLDDLSDIPSPQIKPAQWAKSKVIPQVPIKRVYGYLKAPYKHALMLQAGTGWHVTEACRFANAGEIYRPLPIPFYSLPVVASPLHKSGVPHRTQVSEEVAWEAWLLRQYGKLTYHPYWKALKKACEKAGVEVFTPGRFRHTAATHAIERGATPEEVAAFLDHKDKRTTMRLYATHAVVPKVPTPF